MPTVTLLIQCIRQTSNKKYKTKARKEKDRSNNRRYPNINDRIYR